MPDDLKTENKKLRRQLKAFLSQARENEAKLKRFSDQELELISANTIPDLIRLVLHQYPTTFKLDCISLVLLDPEYELVRMMESAGLQPEQIPELIIETDPAQLRACFADTLLPQLGQFDPQRHARRFSAQPQPIRSRAFIPLIRHGELIGSINVGSYDPERFVEGSGTRFLERFAAIVAVCLENCANHQRIRQLGLTDPLTHVNNRRYFDQRLQEEIAAATRSARPLACMFLDVDHFKHINDTHGHQAGDRVLREVAMLINSQLRQCDILSRYGGEEFVVLLPDTRTTVCQEIAERIRGCIAAHTFRISEQTTLQLTVSIGISGIAPASTERNQEGLAKALVETADRAVYRAKACGRNRIEIASP